MKNQSPSIVVLGGGIAGLVAAHELKKKLPEARITLFEAGENLGGKIRTQSAKGFLWEDGAQLLLPSMPPTAALLRELDLWDKLVPCLPGSRRSYLFTRGKFYPWPQNFSGFAKTPLLSFGEKMRLLGEPFVGPEKKSDTSAGDFGYRRFGKRFTDLFLGTYVKGVMAGDMHHISAQLAFRKFHEWAVQEGSAGRGWIMKWLRSKPRPGRSEEKLRGNPPGGTNQPVGGSAGDWPKDIPFASFAPGMSLLTETLESHLRQNGVELKTSSPVKSVRLDAGKWALELNGERLHCDGILCCLPGNKVGRLFSRKKKSREDIRENSGDNSGENSGDGFGEGSGEGFGESSGERNFETSPFQPSRLSLDYAPLVVIQAGLSESVVAAVPKGLGFWLPPGEKGPLLGCVMSSEIFPHRAPRGEVLWTLQLGGASFPEVVEWDHDTLRNAVAEGLTPMLGQPPDFTLFQIQRYREALPLYPVGHRQQVDAFLAVADKSGAPIAFCGNAFYGSGLNNGIRGGVESARKLAKQFKE